MKKVYKNASVRKDLLEKGLGVPVGTTFYNESAPLNYRWTKDDNFQVRLNGEWLDAESIDFDFN